MDESQATYQTGKLQYKAGAQDTWWAVKEKAHWPIAFVRQPYLDFGEPSTLKDLLSEEKRLSYRIL